MKKICAILLLYCASIGAQTTLPAKSDPIRVGGPWGPKEYSCPAGYQGWYERFNRTKGAFVWVQDSTWIDDGRFVHHCLRSDIDPNKVSVDRMSHAR